MDEETNTTTTTTKRQQEGRNHFVSLRKRKREVRESSGTTASTEAQRANIGAYIKIGGGLFV